MKELVGFIVLGAGLGLLNGNIVKDTWWIDILAFAILAMGLRLVIVGVIESEKTDEK